jgi:oligopeptide transport system substrate-binding protein
MTVGETTIFLIFFFPLLFLSGCVEEMTGGEDATRLSSKTVLRRGNGGEPQTLDPARAEDIHAFNVLIDLYEGLITEAANGDLLPGAAETWEVSDDNLTYTFSLREDARWSNGERVTASEFVAGIRRSVNPATLSPYSFLLHPIRNVPTVAAGELPPHEIAVRAIDESTLAIELSTPAKHFLGILAMPIAFPLFRGDDFDPQQFHMPGKFVGNGPYILDLWSPLEKIRLRRNPKYRNADDVSIDFIEYFPTDDPNAELSRYRAGELDMTATVPTASILKLKESRSDELRISPSLALYYLAFDLTEQPLDNSKLRQALSMAIDRRALVELLGRGEQAAYGIVPPGVAGHEPAGYAWQSLPDSDREARAQSYYAEAGYDADNPLELKLTYDAGDIHEKVALAVSAMWNVVLGAEIVLEKKEWKYFLATRDDRVAWQVMRFAWFGDYNDATTFTDIFRANSPQNLPAYESAEYERLLDAAVLADSNESRVRLMTSAERRLLEDYPLVPLYFFVSKHLVSPRVNNFEPNVLDRHPSQFLELTSTEPRR